MAAENLNRRDFLKLLGISPLSLVKLPQFTLREQVPMEGGPPNILIVVFDALSALNMSLYGYSRRTTPNIERFAEKATVFHRHYAAGNFTSPGTASLLTGVYPWRHRALNLHGVVNDVYADENIFNLLSAGYKTFAYSHNPLVNYLFQQFGNDIRQWTKVSDLCLTSYSYADKFLRRDYNAAYDSELLLFRNGDNPASSFFLSRFERLRRHFSWMYFNQTYQDQFPRGVPNHWDEIAPAYIMFNLEQAIDWLQNQVEEQQQPYLGYVHLLPPHNPYTTRHEFIDRFDDGWQPLKKPENFFTDGYDQETLDLERRAYDEFIAYVDAEFGRLCAFMEQAGSFENTCLIFTSDHGEMFERGIFTHLTPTMYEPILRVPLLMWIPGQDHRQDVTTPTSCVDILPTLMHLTGKDIPDWCEGEVLPMFGGGKPDEERSIFSVEAKENLMHAPLSKATLVLVKGRFKLVHYIGYEGYQDVYEFFDVESDPEEMDDLYPSQPPVMKEMQAELAQKLAEVNRLLLK